MKLEQEIVGKVTVIRIDGRLDASFTTAMHEMFVNFLNDGQTNVLLDMKNVKSISSYGLGVLVTLNKQCKAKGGALKMTNMAQELKVPFEITGVLPQFEVFNDYDMALKSF
jgi:anti-sigma B factor antagonist